MLLISCLSSKNQFLLMSCFHFRAYSTGSVLSKNWNRRGSAISQALTLNSEQDDLEVPLTPYTSNDAALIYQVRCWFNTIQYNTTQYNIPLLINYSRKFVKNQSNLDISSYSFFLYLYLLVEWLFTYLISLNELSSTFFLIPGW